MDLNTNGLIGEKQAQSATTNVTAPADAESATPIKVKGKPGRKPGSKNKNTVAKPEININPDNLNLTSVFNFVTKNRNKIEACNIVGIKFDDIPADKYMMFKAGSDLFLHSNTDALSVIDFDPEKIKIQNSGIICNNCQYRTYVTKTNVIQFVITNGVPTKSYSIKKNKKYESKNAENIQVSVDELKLHINRVSPKLAVAVKDMTTVADIKNGILQFMTNIIDVNHLIKIEEELLMKYAM